VGDDHEPRTFSTYCAVAIALIGKLPPTLHDRSIVIDLKRRLRSEKVESFRLDCTAALDDLVSKAARWAFDNAAKIQAADPKTPDGLFNRDADNWRPLLAIAEAAGGHWPERARESVGLCCQVESDDAGARAKRCSATSATSSPKRIRTKERRRTGSRRGTWSDGWSAWKAILGRRWGKAASRSR
jgi:hypothetical protein